MPRLTRKHKTKRACKKCKTCKKTMRKTCRKYCKKCNKKKQRGGAKSGSYVLKPSGYSIKLKPLRGSKSALANPIPYKSYNK